MLDGEEQSGQLAIGVINKVDQLDNLCDKNKTKNDLVEEQLIVTEYPGDEKNISHDQSNSEYDQCSKTNA